MLRDVLKLPHYLFNFGQSFLHAFGIGGALQVGWRLLELGREADEVYSVKLPSSPQGFLLRARTSDRTIFYQLFVARELDFRIDLDVQLIIDAGANIGCASVFFAQKFPNAKIVAIELDAGNFEMLKANTKPYPQIEAMHAALWPEAVAVKVANPNSDRDAFRASPANDNDPDSIAAVTVRQLVDRFGPIDFLKVDIEGGERELFSAADLSWLDSVRVVAAELHDWCVPGCTAAFNRALAGRPVIIDRSGEYHVVRAA